jgi:bifunctional UDP-N-acetylglucosamine pyrophosphorylase/glucosamine-1-phosphate N-acetyltransferase
LTVEQTDDEKRKQVMQLSQAQNLQNQLDVVIMAGGKGTRMKSRWPKVLHTLGGQSLIEHVIQVAESLGARRKVVVVGHGAQEVQAALTHTAGLHFALQEPQLGTGHALQTAAPHLSNDGLTLVLSGDVPLIERETLQSLLAASEGQYLTLLNLYKEDPFGYGRIVRTQSDTQHPLGQIQAIVEEKDASESERAIQEIYSGVMVVPNRLLKPWLTRLQPNNAQNEYYLTDLVKMAHADAQPIQSFITRNELEVSGVNDPVQLAQMERAYQGELARKLMLSGVRLRDPQRIDIRGELVCASDVEIDVNCVFMGKVILESGVRIEPNCVIANARIKSGALVKAFTHIQGEALDESLMVEVGELAQVGPYSRLRPGAKLGREVHVGNFVEIKNASLGEGAKANHLAYIGDASLGERVNYGAGSITANYDGANKHHTRIEADVHVGSNSVLVAPVTIGAGGTIGAGSTITKDTPQGALTVVRAKAVSLMNWARPVKKSKKPGGL